MKLCMSYVQTLKKMLKAVVERFNGILASEGSEVLEEKTGVNAVLLMKLKISKKVSITSYALKLITTEPQTNSNV